MKKKTTATKKVATRKKKSVPSPVEKLFHGVTFKDLLVPIAILAGSLIIGGCIVAVHSPYEATLKKHEQYVAKVDDVIVKKKITTNNQIDAAKIIPVTEVDHVRGDRDAKVTIVEYSDFDCPFCSRVHGTLQTLVDEYDGEVAWAYRHFPLTSLHPNAERIAQASECVAAEGGDEAFWKFVDGYFSQAIGTDLSGVEDVTGVSQDVVETCIENGTYADVVATQMQNAKDTGGTGTPWSVLIGPNGSYSVVKGAQPLKVWQREIDALLSK